MTTDGRDKFDAIDVGASATLTRQITREDVDRFVELTGDDNPLHVDRAYAEATPYKDIVVHGMLGASFLSTLIGTRLPGEGAVWVSQAMTFARPVRIDDTLTLTAVVTRKHARERLLELEMRIENQDGELVLSGEGAVKVMEPPAPSREEPATTTLAAVVVGGAGGIGRAVCRALVRDGMRVAIGYRGGRDRAEALAGELTAAGGNVRSVPVDITDAHSVEAMVDRVREQLGPIGVVVHSASGPIHPMDLDTLSWDAIQAHIDADVRGIFNLAQSCVAQMRDQQFGRIVAVTSGVLDGAPTPHWTAYAVGKAALATFVRSLAVELGPQGITANCVSPGMTDARLIADIPEKLRLVIGRQTPVRRLATPEDVAEAVAFLASPRAGYITGETLRVNGGQITL